jgi:hypothetical protein
MRLLVLLQFATMACWSPCFSQCDEPALRARYLAEIAFRQKDYHNAVDLYRQSMEGGAIGVSGVAYALECAAAIGDTAALMRFLAIGYTLGLDEADYRRWWPRIGGVTNLKTLLDPLNPRELRRQYQSGLDKKLSRKLKKLAKRDQRYRSESKDLKFHLQKDLDKRNWAELRQIVLTLGRLPHYAEIGMVGSEDLDILFMHMDAEPIAWFLPYILALPPVERADLSRRLLYQIDRIGMDEGVIYTITASGNLEVAGPRWRMSNGYWCQTWGEWFDEKSRIDQKIYATPIDPSLLAEEVDRVRAMFCLDPIASHQKRRPWVTVVSVEDFEQLIDY